MIELKNVSFSFEDGVLFQDVSFRVEDGQFVGIIGANGAGTTTLIRLILGLIKRADNHSLSDVDIFGNDSLIDLTILTDNSSVHND